MSLKIIACEVIKEELLGVASGRDIEFEFLSQGKHNYPDKLGQELQDILDGQLAIVRKELMVRVIIPLEHNPLRHRHAEEQCHIQAKHCLPA